MTVLGYISDKDRNRVIVLYFFAPVPLLHSWWEYCHTVNEPYNWQWYFAEEHLEGCLDLLRKLQKEYHTSYKKNTIKYIVTITICNYPIDVLL